MTDVPRVIVIGAGHNGLVCAAYLARAGQRVLVLEAAHRVGGAAITREFAPGFRVSAGAHLLNLLDPRVVRDLALARHGLSWSGPALRTVALSESAQPLVIDGPAAIAGGALSASDQRALPRYLEQLHRFAAVLARQHGRVPPRLAWQGWREGMGPAALAFDLRMLGRRDLREFLRLATMNVFDVLDEYFESPQLKGALALDGVLGGRLGARSGGSYFASLHRASGAHDGQLGARMLPRGGLGALSEAIAAAARGAGAEIRLGASVVALALDAGRVVGLRLASGEQIDADTIVSGADPKTTLLHLLGARHLEMEFARRVQNLRTHGTAAKLHLALAGVPEFNGLDPRHAGERLVIAPDLEYIEQAFNPAKYGEFSQRPLFEITLPSLRDATLAPLGQHVLSAIVQYAPYEINGGWGANKERFLTATLDELERYSPQLRRQILAAELLTPRDIEAEFGMAGGHWHHGELSLDQFMMLRPVHGAAQYATPVCGLYLCSAGCHPGGGVMGTAGRNAARVVLAELGHK